ncbi:MAG: hypothetical protein DCC75_04160 [Proteobacteria bacterium]|nr:MAG: hypothetical protein DCC75_04160 [Pseudomonadota bacterium]
MFIFLNYASKARIEAFVEYCRLQPSIVYLIKALGEWDYELNIEVADAAAFRSLMMDLTRRFADIVRDYYALPVAELCKFTGMPEGAEVALGIR